MGKKLSKDNISYDDIIENNDYINDKEEIFIKEHQEEFI